MKSESFKTLLSLYNEFKKESNKTDFGFDVDWDLFIKMMSLLSPKSYGTKIQNRIIKKNNFKQISQKGDSGDCKNQNNEIIEIKTSLVSLTNKIANISGLRKYQIIDYYYIIINDVRDIDQIKTYIYKLTKNQMLIEMKLMKSSPIYGTKTSNKGNDPNNIPYRIGFPIDPNNEHYNRWEKDYKTKDLVL